MAEPGCQWPSLPIGRQTAHCVRVWSASHGSPGGVGGELWRSPAFSRPVQPLRELKSTTPIPLALIPMILEVLLRLRWWSARVRCGLPHNVAAVVRHDRRILRRTIRLSQPGARWRANRGVRHCLRKTRPLDAFSGEGAFNPTLGARRQHSARVQNVRQSNAKVAQPFLRARLRVVLTPR